MQTLSNFFNTFDRDFYSKKNSVSQVYTYLPKIQKKSQKMLLSSMLKLRSVRAIPNVITYLSFVFPTNLIWFNLLHCNAMNFDSFPLDARHLFQNVVIFFSYMRLHMSYIVVFRIKISIRMTKKKCPYLKKNILTV
jgi:hypothetical protein